MFDAALQVASRLTAFCGAMSCRAALNYSLIDEEVTISRALLSV